jgi:hypothetical protein
VKLAKVWCRIMRLIMATRKRSAASPKSHGVLEKAAKAIGSALGSLAVRTGIATPVTTKKGAGRLTVKDGETKPLKNNEDPPEGGIGCCDGGHSNSQHFFRRQEHGLFDLASQ